MIHDEIVGYDVAKLAKEKGFNCSQPIAMYNENGELYSLCTSAGLDCYEFKDFDSNDVIAPTQSLLQRWLRDEKNIVFGISPMQEMDCDYLGWCATIYKVDKNGYGLSWKEALYYNTYELALEDALAYALKNLV